MTHTQPIRSFPPDAVLPEGTPPFYKSSGPLRIFLSRLLARKITLGETEILSRDPEFQDVLSFANCLVLPGPEELLLYRLPDARINISIYCDDETYIVSCPTSGIKKVHYSKPIASYLYLYNFDIENSYAWEWRKGVSFGSSQVVAEIMDQDWLARVRRGVQCLNTDMGFYCEYVLMLFYDNNDKCLGEKALITKVSRRRIG